MNIDYHQNLQKLQLQEDDINKLYLNIHSLRKKFDDLYALIYSLNYTIHIIVLTETWLYSSEIKTINLNGYKCILKFLGLSQLSLSFISYFSKNAIEFTL